MSRIKRVGLSFVCAIASELLVVVVLTSADHSGLTGLFAGMIGFSIFVIPGWLLSLPLVISFDRADGWRFWVLGAYGTLLGPAVIFAVAIVGKVRDGGAIADFNEWYTLALVVGLLSTAIYLYVLKNFSRDSIEQAQI